jgi:hypothetical protein
LQQRDEPILPVLAPGRLDLCGLRFRERVVRIGERFGLEQLSGSGVVALGRRVVCLLEGSIQRLVRREGVRQLGRVMRSELVLGRRRWRVVAAQASDRACACQRVSCIK